MAPLPPLGGSHARVMNLRAGVRGHREQEARGPGQERWKGVRIGGCTWWR